MSQPLYASYQFEGLKGPSGISILLSDERFDLPATEWLRELHAATDQWSLRSSDRFVRSDLGTGPGTSCHRARIADYLFASGDVNFERLGRHLDMLWAQGHVHRFALRPGGRVDGLDLVGREDRLARLEDLLSKDSCHLRAPRRYGKTSLLRQLEKTLTAAGKIAIFVDVSGGESSPLFWVSLAQAAMDVPAARGPLSTLEELTYWPPPEASAQDKGTAAEALEERIARNPASFGNRLLETLGQAAAVLLLDEFSVFLREAHQSQPEEARRLAEILARARSGSTPVRQVLAGSTGLTSFMKFRGLTESFADLVPLDLPPLTPSLARMLVEELLYGEELVPSPAVIHAILETVGEPIPYFLHAVVNAVVEESPARSLLKDPGLVARAYAERILGPLGNGLFSDFRLRERPYPRELLPAAARLLREFSRTGAGLEIGVLRDLFASETSGVSALEGASLETLLACLQEDYDVTEENGRWRLRSKVLRDRWTLREPWLTRGH